VSGLCCPVCCKDFDGYPAWCPHCSADLQEFWKSADLLEELIAALNHPNASRAMQAAWLLGKVGDQRAVEPLKCLLVRARDAHLTRAVKVALHCLGASVEPQTGVG